MTNNFGKELYDMDELVIFSSPLMCVIIGAIIVLHVVGALVSELGLQKTLIKLSVWTSTVLNGVAHIAVLFHAFKNKAEPEELLLFLMISSAVAMTAIGLKEKVSRGGKK